MHLRTLTVATLMTLSAGSAAAETARNRVKVEPTRIAAARTTSASTSVLPAAAPTATPAPLMAPVAMPAPKSCPSCGSGIPDAQLSSRLALGGDATNVFEDRVRVYVRLDQQKRTAKGMQFSVDVGAASGVVLFGSRF